MGQAEGMNALGDLASQGELGQGLEKVVTGMRTLLERPVPKDPGAAHAMSRLLSQLSSCSRAASQVELAKLPSLKGDGQSHYSRVRDHRSQRRGKVCSHGVSSLCR